MTTSTTTTAGGGTTPARRPAQPTPQTATLRRGLRREIRALLGTTSDKAPGLLSVLDAVDYFNQLLRLTSGGRYRLELIDNTSGLTTDPRKARQHERGTA